MLSCLTVKEVQQKKNSVGAKVGGSGLVTPLGQDTYLASMVPHLKINESGIIKKKHNPNNALI